jgi:hypothetical protein
MEVTPVAFRASPWTVIRVNLLLAAVSKDRVIANNQRFVGNVENQH